MAGKAITYPLARLSSRGLAAQAAVKPSETLPSPEINCTVMPSKLMVNSVDLHGPLTRVTLAFKVGPRNEVPKNIGSTHIIRSMAGFATKQCSWFAIVRNTQQNGVHFTCTGDREVTAFNIVGTRNKINCVLKYFGEAATSPAFKPWQVKDNFDRVKYEIRSLTPRDKLFDNLHKACYRTGLGNSLFVQEDFIGTHTPEMLKNFFQEGFTANRAALTGYNIDHKDLLEFAGSLNFTCNDPPVGNSKYFGGEIRQDKNSYFAHVAIATQGVGTKDLKESLLHAVLQHAYGIHPSISWGGSPSPLYKAVHPVAPDAGASCFNIGYSDSGLFGVAISSFADTAGKAIRAAANVLKSGTVSQSDVNRAKSMLKMNILSSCENTENVVEDMAVQSLSGGIIIPGPVLAEAVDKITHGDVSEVAKKIAAKKFSLSAVGDLTEIPFLDDLF